MNIIRQANQMYLNDLTHSNDNGLNENKSEIATTILIKHPTAFAVR